MKPIEEWRDLKNTLPWLWAMVRVELPAGSQLAETDYDQLCQRLASQPISGER